MPIIHSDPREVTVTAYSQMMLSKEETNRFQAACKAHGRTITQVATAISNLVLTEALLRVAGSRSSDLFEEVRSTLQSSTRFMTNTNTVNMVSYDSRERDYEAYATRSVNSSQTSTKILEKIKALLCVRSMGLH